MTNLSLVDVGIDWDAELLRALYELVFAKTDREVAGLLAGKSVRGLDFGLPEVKAALPASEGFVTGQAAMFTHEIWANVHAAMAADHPKLELVGWYISRPGLGTDPTWADVENHRRWFASEGQILMVVDSLSHRAAIFRWSGGGLIPMGEGTIARRYTRAPRPGFPSAAVALLALVGALAGMAIFLLTNSLGA